MWEELRRQLGQLRVVLVETTPQLWQVTGTAEGMVFHAHPAFLDLLRVNGRLSDLLTGESKVAGPWVSRLRIVLDNRLDDARAARTRLGIVTAGRFDGLADLLQIMLHYETVSKEGAVLGTPSVLTEATTFADTLNPATVGDFIQLHALYVYAVKALIRAATFKVGPAVTDQNRLQLVTDAYNKGDTAAARVQSGRLPLNAAAAWQTHTPGFAETVKQNVGSLNFGTRSALIGHSFKHLPVGNPEDTQTMRFPGDQDFMNGLVGTYLTDARAKITGTENDAVTSELGQLALTRTYYFGTVGQNAAMVAVNAAGEAWITTYYATGIRT